MEDYINTDKKIFFFIPYPPICGHPIAIFAPEKDYKPLKFTLMGYWSDSDEKELIAQGELDDPNGPGCMTEFLSLIFILLGIVLFFTCAAS